MTLRFHRGLQVPSLRFVSLVNWTAFNAGRGRISNFARKKSNTEVVHVRRGRRDCTSLPIPAFFARYACHVKGGFCELSASFVHLGGVPGQHRPRSPLCLSNQECPPRRWRACSAFLPAGSTLHSLVSSPLVVVTSRLGSNVLLAPPQNRRLPDTFTRLW